MRDEFDAQGWIGEIYVGNVLDDLYTEIDRHARVSPIERDAIALWAAHTHLVHNYRVCLAVSPKLAIQAPSRGSGKSTLLELVGAVSYRAIIASSISASAVFRTVDAGQNSLMLDEADNVLDDNKSELNAVLNASHRRSTGYVMRVEKTPDGRFETVRFSAFTAIALAGINKLPATLQDRSIVVQMKKVTLMEARELTHLRDGMSPELDAIRSQLRTWGEALDGLPDPYMPNGLFNRRGDNWRPLIAIAELAGGDWPERVRRAAMTSVDDQSDDSFFGLLATIQRAFGARKKMTSDELIEALIADTDEEYGTENRGRPITPKWLARQLAEVLEPRGPQKWRKGKKTERGYILSQFADVFIRYGLAGSDCIGTSEEASQNAQQSGSANSTLSDEPPGRRATSATRATAQRKQGVTCGGYRGNNRHIGGAEWR